MNLDKPDYFSFIKGMKKDGTGHPESLIRQKQTKAIVQGIEKDERKIGFLSTKGIEGFLQS